MVVCGCGGSRAAPPRDPFAAADSLRLEGRSSESQIAYRALRDAFALRHDTANLWRAQLWWGEALTENSRRDSARSALDGAMMLAAGDANREGWTRYVRSIFYDRQGKFDSAFADATRARVLARTTGDGRLEASADHAMGRIHSLTGHYAEALDDNTRALALERATAGESSHAVTSELNELGIDYRHLGRFTDAEHALEQALALERAHHNPEGVARVSSNLANVYVATGDDNRALRLMTDALRGAEQTGNVRGEVYVHGDIADLYSRNGNLDAARAHLRAALALNRDGFLAYGRVQSLDALGHVELADHRPQVAVVVLDSARRLADSAGFGRERVTSRAALARAVTALGFRDKALRWGGAAVRIADSLGDPDAEIEAREAHAAALEGAARTGALDEYRRSIALLESWRGRLALGDLRMGVAEPRLAPFEGAIRILVRQGRAAEAFDIAERARARLLLDLMAEHEMGQPHSRPEELRQRLRERFAMRDDVAPTERVAVDRDIAALTDSLNGAERESQESDRLAGASHPAPLPLATVQTEVLTPGRALLSFFWGDSAVYGWWISRSAVRAVRLGQADSLGALVDFLRGAIDDPSGTVAWAAAAHHVFARLVAPLAPDSADVILVVADGPLAYLPLEVLVPRAGGQPWAASRQFLYGPSASVLTALARAPTHQRWTRAVLAVGNPESPTGGSPVWAGSGRAEAWAPLPYSASEATDVAALFQNSGADLLLGRSATVERWNSLHPGRYRYLHFAAHAEINDRRPEESGLVLGSGALDLPAIRRLDLTAELVTLSACETGLGRRVRGEGVIGLPHAFLAAGAQGVIVTLWRVADRSAADFMHDFYRELLAGRTPAAALREVRRARMAGLGPSSHPSHWAPFVLVGAMKGD